MYSDKSRVLGCLMGGAVGDAFGAPLEALFTKEEIREYGARGLQEFTYYKSPWDDSEREGVGIITDDTTMTACTLAALIETPKNKKFVNASLNMSWQYYMLWGREQKYGKVIEKAAQINVEPPVYLEPFLFRCGAGLNTLAGLSTGYRGTLERPLVYEREIDKRKLVSPNKGCGGQMRIAPVAFLYEDMDIIRYSMQNAAITHGDPNAIAATCATAVLTANALKYKTLDKAMKKSKQDFKKIPNNGGILDAWRQAEEAFALNKPTMKTMDDLTGRNEKKNPFLALPVLTQTLYGLHVAADIKAPSEKDFKKIIRLSANHTGDSDSVAAIVGNVVGASWGYEAVPKDWSDLIEQKTDVFALGVAYLKEARQKTLSL